MMRWQTPKGTIELASLSVNDKHTIPVSELYRDALGHFNNGNLVEANTLCQSILNCHPEHTDTLHLAGLVYHQTASITGPLNLSTRLSG
jgi:hypothetical protein